MEQSRLKVHRRKVFLDGRAFTALSPRPDDGPRLTTTGGGDTTPVVGDEHSSRLLAQLCWAMAYQRSESTIVVLDGAAALPVAIVNSDLGTPSESDLALLAPMLPWTAPSDGTINLNTRSLESAVANQPAFYAQQKRDGIGDIKHQHRLIKDVAGILVLAAPAVVLKSWGVQLSTPDDQRPGWFVTTAP